MNNSRKILFVCQEVAPYVAENDMSQFCRTLIQSLQERGNEVRTFMPRYGCINERRNQLHEVIRLSGMNLIIGKNDHQLIIKVATLPSSRAQIYFIDNEDYFSRKYTTSDSDGVLCEDNDERAIFFARGVIETVKKLLWRPDVVHCHGWFSAIAAIYLKNTFADDPLFKHVKVVFTLYNNPFQENLPGNLRIKIGEEGIACHENSLDDNPSYYGLINYVIEHVDGIAVGYAGPNPVIKNIIENSGKPVMWYQEKEDGIYAEEYLEFYDGL